MAWEAAGAIAGVASVVVGLLQAAMGSSHDLHDAQANFTKMYLDMMGPKHPTKNILITCVAHEKNFVNEFHEVAELGTWFGGIKYDCYVFDSGDFTLKGDGGWINWAFTGSFDRDGGHVVFYNMAPPPPEFPPPPPTDQGAPRPRQADGVYLVNSFRGNDKSSGLAYYKNMRYGGNDGQQPDDYVDIKHGDLVNWESTNTGTFNGGTKFTSYINGDAQSRPDFALCGGATNTYRNMEIFKDKQRVLYEIDGWKVFTMYWCN